MEEKSNDIIKRNNSIGRALEQVFAFALITMFFAGFAYLYITNGELQEQVEERDELVKTIRLKHNDFVTGKESVDSLLTSYTVDCKIKIDGQELTLEDLVRTISTLKDSISRLQHTSKLLELEKNNETSDRKMFENLYNSGSKDIDTLIGDLNSRITQLNALRRNVMVLDRARTIYGFDLNYKLEGGDIIISGSSRSRADSARLLYQVFKDKIIYDSVTNRMGVRY